MSFLSKMTESNILFIPCDDTKVKMKISAEDDAEFDSFNLSDEEPEICFVKRIKSETKRCLNDQENLDCQNNKKPKNNEKIVIKTEIEPVRNPNTRYSLRASTINQNISNLKPRQTKKVSINLAKFTPLNKIPESTTTEDKEQKTNPGKSKSKSQKKETIKQGIEKKLKEKKENKKDSVGRPIKKRSKKVSDKNLVNTQDSANSKKKSNSSERSNKKETTSQIDQIDCKSDTGVEEKKSFEQQNHCEELSIKQETHSQEESEPNLRSKNKNFVESFVIQEIFAKEEKTQCKKENKSNLVIENPSFDECLVEPETLPKEEKTVFGDEVSKENSKKKRKKKSLVKKSPVKKSPVKKSPEINDLRYQEPFKHGWKRELVHRASPSHNGNRMDVYYYAPNSKKKLRSLKEIGQYLENSKSNSPLSKDNFTLYKGKIANDPTKEIVRNSRYSLSKEPCLVKKKQHRSDLSKFLEKGHWCPQFNADFELLGFKYLNKEPKYPEKVVCLECSYLLEREGFVVSIRGSSSDSASGTSSDDQTAQVESTFLRTVNETIEDVTTTRRAVDNDKCESPLSKRSASCEKNVQTLLEDCFEENDQEIISSTRIEKEAYCYCAGDENSCDGEADHNDEFFENKMNPKDLIQRVESPKSPRMVKSQIKIEGLRNVNKVAFEDDDLRETDQENIVQIKIENENHTARIVESQSFVTKILSSRNVSQIFESPKISSLEEVNHKAGSSESSKENLLDYGLGKCDQGVVIPAKMEGETENSTTNVEKSNKLLLLFNDSEFFGTKVLDSKDASNKIESPKNSSLLEIDIKTKSYEDVNTNTVNYDSHDCDKKIPSLVGIKIQTHNLSAIDDNSGVIRSDQDNEFSKSKVVISNHDNQVLENQENVDMVEMENKTESSENINTDSPNYGLQEYNNAYKEITIPFKMEIETPDLPANDETSCHKLSDQCDQSFECKILNLENDTPVVDSLKCTGLVKIKNEVLVPENVVTNLFNNNLKEYDQEIIPTIMDNETGHQAVDGGKSDELSHLHDEIFEKKILNSKAAIQEVVEKTNPAAVEIQNADNLQKMNTILTHDVLKEIYPETDSRTQIVDKIDDPQTIHSLFEKSSFTVTDQCEKSFKFESFDSKKSSESLISSSEILIENNAVPQNEIKNSLRNPLLEVEVEFATSDEFKTNEVYRDQEESDHTSTDAPGNVIEPSFSDQSIQNPESFPENFLDEGNPCNLVDFSSSSTKNETMPDSSKTESKSKIDLNSTKKSVAGPSGTVKSFNLEPSHGVIITKKIFKKHDSGLRDGIYHGGNTSLDTTETVSSSDSLISSDSTDSNFENIDCLESSTREMIQKLESLKNMDSPNENTFVPTKASTEKSKTSALKKQEINLKILSEVVGLEDDMPSGEPNCTIESSNVKNENKTNVSEGFTPENKSPNLSQLINESFFKNLEKGYLPWPTFLNDTSTEISFNQGIGKSNELSLHDKNMYFRIERMSSQMVSKILPKVGILDDDDDESLVPEENVHKMIPQSSEFNEIPEVSKAFLTVSTTEDFTSDLHQSSEKLSDVVKMKTAEDQSHSRSLIENVNDDTRKTFFDINEPQTRSFDDTGNISETFPDEYSVNQKEQNLDLTASIGLSNDQAISSNLKACEAYRNLELQLMTKSFESSLVTEVTDIKSKESQYKFISPKKKCMQALQLESCDPIEKNDCVLTSENPVVPDQFVDIIQNLTNKDVKKTIIAPSGDLEAENSFSCTDLELRAVNEILETSIEKESNSSCVDNILSKQNLIKASESVNNVNNMKALIVNAAETVLSNVEDKKILSAFDNIESKNKNFTEVDRNLSEGMEFSNELMTKNTSFMAALTISSSTPLKRPADSEEINPNRKRVKYDLTNKSQFPHSMASFCAGYESLKHIFNYLTVEELMVARKVCKSWKEVISKIIFEEQKLNH